MDLLEQHEAFLRAIFDAPDDDTPRLIYADLLEENGEEERAQFIRWQCDPIRWQRPRFLEEMWGQNTRGFRAPWKAITLKVSQLGDHLAFRRYAVAHCPECFGVEAVRITGGKINTSEPFDVLFAIPAFARVTELNLAGEERSVAVPGDLPDYVRSVLGDFVLEPVITSAGVEALAQHRGARRLTSLILTNNNLDNDAARALAASPYLDNLKHLQLRQGNRLRGKVWQQVLARFGADVAE
jgi:uncharacterized protein (TIGR02996 family)